MDTKTLLDLIANQGFPISLSILLIFRIDKFMQEIVVTQKEGHRQILENTKEIHNQSLCLNMSTSNLMKFFYPIFFSIFILFIFVYSFKMISEKSTKSSK